MRCLQQLADDEGHRFPLAVPSITHGRYVDDIYGGADTVPQLIETARQLNAMCIAGGFPLAKWHSTHLDLLRAISPEDSRESVVSLDDCTTKMLGLQWTPKDDSFVLKSASTQAEFLTKGLILSGVARIFDPLGFLSPVVVRAKMLLQKLWLHKLGWDDPLLSRVSQRWLIIREDLTNLCRISIPRWFNTWSDTSVEIHGFADASQLAMAAVVCLIVRFTVHRNYDVIGLLKNKGSTSQSTHHPEVRTHGSAATLKSH